MDDKLKDGTANQANRDPNMAVTSSESVSKVRTKIWLYQATLNLYFDYEIISWIHFG